MKCSRSMSVLTASRLSTSRRAGQRILRPAGCHSLSGQPRVWWTIPDCCRRQLRHLDHLCADRRFLGRKRGGIRKVAITGHFTGGSSTGTIRTDTSFSHAGKLRLQLRQRDLDRFEGLGARPSVQGGGRSPAFRLDIDDYTQARNHIWALSWTDTGHGTPQQRLNNFDWGYKQFYFPSCVSGYN